MCRGSQSNSLSTTDCSHEVHLIAVRTSNQIRFHYRHIAQGCNPANLCYPTFSTSTGLDVLGGLRRQTPFQPVPPYRLSTSWPFPRPGSTQKTLPLQLPSHLPTHFHTPFTFTFTLMPIQIAPSLTVTSDGLPCFSPLSSEDVLTLVMSNCASTRSLDPIPSLLLQNISHDILPFLTTLINSSHTSGIIPAPFKILTQSTTKSSSPLQTRLNLALLTLL